MLSSQIEKRGNRVVVEWGKPYLRRRFEADSSAGKESSQEPIRELGLIYKRHSIESPIVQTTIGHAA